MKYNQEFEKEFNTLLVNTFHNILKTELQLIKSISNTDLSMREIHLLEIVGEGNGPITISDIAKSFQITLASVTVMVNKLSDLGYVVKKKGNNDARIIYVELTKKGKNIDEQHYNFHKTMVQKIAKGLTDFEREVLYSGVKSLNNFFNQQLEED